MVYAFTEIMHKNDGAKNGMDTNKNATAAGERKYQQPTDAYIIPVFVMYTRMKQ